MPFVVVYGLSHTLQCEGFPIAVKHTNSFSPLAFTFLWLVVKGTCFFLAADASWDGVSQVATGLVTVWVSPAPRGTGAFIEWLLVTDRCGGVLTADSPEVSSLWCGKTGRYRDHMVTGGMSG